MLLRTSLSCSPAAHRGMVVCGSIRRMLSYSPPAIKQGAGWNNCARPVSYASLERYSVQALKAKHKIPSLSGHAMAKGGESAVHANSTLASTTPGVGSNGNGASASKKESKRGYKLPPQEILEIVDTPPQPSLSFSPDRTKIFQLFRPPSLPPIHELSRPELKLAGLRIDADLSARSRMGYYTGVAIVPSTETVPAPEEKLTRVTGYPEGSWLNYVAWSPDSRHISFTVRSPGGAGDPPRQPLELWVADASTGKSRCLLPLPTYGLNTIFDDYGWLDDDTIIALLVPEGRGTAPSKPRIPPGPKVQDNSSGSKAQNRTFTDLLKDEHDGELLEYYGQSQIVTVDVASGNINRIGPPGLYIEVDPSPDGRYLLVSWLERPFSYTVPVGRFPRRTQLWTREGVLVRELAALPLAEDIPIAFNSVRKGPRAIGWRDDKPAELSWVECQDGGDPAVEVSPRDIVYTLDADVAATAAAGGDGEAAAAPQELARTDLRCNGVAWCDGDLAIVFESWYKNRRSVWWTMAPDRREEGKKVLFDRNYEDVYSDPGSPATRRTPFGTYVIAKLDGERKLLMQGTGATPEGNRPFLNVLDIDSGSTTTLWRNTGEKSESTGSLLGDTEGQTIHLSGLSLLMTRETPRDPPQTFVMTRGADGSWTERQLTNFPHPYPQLRDMTKEVVRYERDDGVALTGTLYLPPGYSKEKDGPLPCILWAYPREYKSKDAAGQMRRSPYQFSGVGSMSPTLWVARGYAVLDGPTFPIVAEGEEEPNDTFVEQLTGSARAAVAELERRGVADLARLSVGGHSYGAFMAANLVAHAPELFAAGIARSGAYNRTLTPFGFQSEERSLWQAKDTYSTLSPFMVADRVSRPLLLIHGEEDNNPGTFPLQSERFYSALKGHGCKARLVVLPHEGHSYRARESVLHMLYEQDQWLERYAGYGRVDPDYTTSDSEAEGEED